MDLYKYLLLELEVKSEFVEVFVEPASSYNIDEIFSEKTLLDSLSEEE
ncbi:MAG: hypothetical protein LKI94_09605 [Sporolactobacillus sp.]|jgi:hypothetical protein|nr:hypothetical protein [Sporolactobacillus sp.]MCI1882435.1 hypothetical protein [Sporolactobacillus sp.]